MPSPLRIILPCLSVFAPLAEAQWTPIRLSDALPGSAAVYAVSGGRQGGYQTIVATPSTEAGIWSGSPETWQTLSPGRNARVYAMWGDRQGGNIHVPGSPGMFRATLWSGTPESQIDLHPAGYSDSNVWGMWGDEQVGGAGQGHAGVWHGTAESFVDLHPAGASESVAYGTDGVHQYGYAQIPGAGFRAAMWSGSAGSFVSLHPGAPYSGSQILAANPAGQAGWAYWPASPEGWHAAYWSGSAQSFVDLHPTGYYYSRAYGLCDSAIVGMAGSNLTFVPAIWLGPEHAFQLLPLPPGYATGAATSIEFYNGQYYIGGYAARSGFQPDEAFLWIGVPAPSAVLLLLLGGAAASARRR